MSPPSPVANRHWRRRAWATIRRSNGSRVQLTVVAFSNHAAEGGSSSTHRSSWASCPIDAPLRSRNRPDSNRNCGSSTLAGDAYKRVARVSSIATGIAAVQPDQRVGIKQDQRPGRFVKARPDDRQLQVHVPSATAGSTMSRRTGRRRRRVWRSEPSALSANRTPRRSMTTCSPRSAASSTAERRSRT